MNRSSRALRALPESGAEITRAQVAPSGDSDRVSQSRTGLHSHVCWTDRPVGFCRIRSAVFYQNLLWLTFRSLVWGRSCQWKTAGFLYFCTA